MEGTKERILTEALGQFAKNGYEAVSVRDIAKALGITQSALYKHYGSKRDIFDCIVARMEVEDAKRAESFGVPAQSFESSAEEYKKAELSRLKDFTLAQFQYWTEDEFASGFRKMLTLEQYRSPEMSALYQQYLSSGIIAYLTDLFREMPATADCSPELPAVELFGPLYMLMNLFDAAENKKQIRSRAEKHVDRFFERYSKE